MSRAAQGRGGLAQEAQPVTCDKRRQAQGRAMVQRGGELWLWWEPASILFWLLLLCYGNGKQCPKPRPKTGEEVMQVWGGQRGLKQRSRRGWESERPGQGRPRTHLKSM